MRFRLFAVSLWSVIGFGCPSDDSPSSLASALDSALSAGVHYRELRCDCERKQDPSDSCKVRPLPSARERACYTRVLEFDETMTRPYLSCLERAYNAASACVGTANSCSCEDVLDLYRDACAELPDKVEQAFDECEEDSEQVQPPTATVARTAAGAEAPQVKQGTAGSAAPAASVNCGPNVCISAAAIGGMSFPAACCADVAAGTCGFTSGGTCMPRPAVAAKCPMPMAAAGLTVSSCCRPDNTCGVDASALGMGCAPYSSLASAGLKAPPATHCDGTPVM